MRTISRDLPDQRNLQQRNTIKKQLASETNTQSYPITLHFKVVNFHYDSHDEADKMEVRDLSILHPDRMAAYNQELNIRMNKMLLTHFRKYHSQGYVNPIAGWP